MPEILVEEYRGGILENSHTGRICVVDEKGSAVKKVGDCLQKTFYRSSSKPLQLLPVLVHGLDKKYGLTGEETTIMAGSHSAEFRHVEVLESILAKTGIKEEDLIMKPVFPCDIEHRNYLIKNDMKPRKLYHNCAGKHISLMLLSRELGAEVRDYWKFESPAQQEVLKYISYLSGCPAGEIGIGIDGCGVPVFAVPLQGIAASYMKFACPDVIADHEISAAAARLAHLVNENPYMMRGHGFVCGEFNTDKNVFAKGGAKGVYGFGLKKERLGVALKIEDGTEEAWPLIIEEILVQLGYKNNNTLEILQKLAPKYIVNDNDTRVGESVVVFKLK